MTVGIAAASANSILDTFCATLWVKLHIGDPGAAGTANAAGETTRKQATFSAAAAGAITNSAALDWTAVSTAETYSHVSWWTASTAGTFKGSDDLAVARTVAVGDNFTIAAGDIDISLGAVAA